jgi:hypothetical protein
MIDAGTKINTYGGMEDTCDIKTGTTTSVLFALFWYKPYDPSSHATGCGDGF